MAEKRGLVGPNEDRIGIGRQCGLLGLSRSGYYKAAKGESALNLELMRQIDKQYLLTPFYGVRMMCGHLRQHLGYEINPKRVRRLYKLMGLEAITPKPLLSKADRAHKIYPYLLRNVTIEGCNHVWSTDITFIPMPKGFLYLIAVMDWYSRFVLGWDISNTQDSDFCARVLRRVLDKYGRPRIFNTDQGSQFTANRFTEVLLCNQIEISMDGKGRATDNAFVERLWRSVKHEYVYLNCPENGQALYSGLKEYFDFYNTKRLHSALGYKSPADVYKPNL